MTETKYPESGRMLAVSDKHKLISEFLDFASEHDWSLGRTVNGDTAFGSGVWTQEINAPQLNRLLASFFSIDLNKVETERREMLASYQEVIET